MPDATLWACDDCGNVIATGYCEEEPSTAECTACGEVTTYTNIGYTQR